MPRPNDTIPHTPGPWRVGDAGRTVFGPKREDGQLPEIVAQRLRPADARLIAAAPDLLRALKRLLRESETWPDGSPSCTAAEDAARGVIARAEGRAEG